MAKAMATLKTKVLATISCLWIAGAALLVLIAYSQISGALNSEIRTRLRGCAALGALSVPADEHARLRVRADEGTKEYADVIAALGRIQAGSADVKFVYTVRRAADGKVVFIGDATEDEKDRSHLGDVYEDASELLKGSIGGIDGVVLEKNFYTDQWGTFLSAYAPIRAPTGRWTACCAWTSHSRACGASCGAISSSSFSSPPSASSSSSPWASTSRATS